ncbi:DnaJ-class molecular chaperone [Streptomonospora salina]|uniref:DnaJ-class molecular chaperone n=1 Tax=Streptomonospora salina TaxID=104205 RepID=A0A841E4J5_9ACTN|nr:DnaJ-class molecular chaperone [Streptomonospora salina]
MGKHGKEVNCPGCGGRKEVQESQDGKIVRVPCKLCNGTGKQPQ